MVGIIDQFYAGLLGPSKIKFNGGHFNQRLALNNLDFDYVQNQILYAEPIDYRRSKTHRNRYEFFYQAPPNKDYEYFKVILQDCNDYISLVSIMDDGKSSKNSKRNASKPKDMRKRELLRQKAVLKRRNF